MKIWQPAKTSIWTPQSDDSNYHWITQDIAIGMEPPNKATIKKIIEDGANNFLCLHRKEPGYDREGFNINFKQIKVADNQLLSFNQAKKGIDFIEECIEKGEKVFVHCEMGVSRSAMFVVLYFITHSKMNFTEAMVKIMEKRSCAHPSQALINFDLIIDLINHYKGTE